MKICFSLRNGFAHQLREQHFSAEACTVLEGVSADDFRDSEARISV